MRAQGAPEAAESRFMSGAGCTYCNLTGYRGRIAVYEMLEIDRALTDAIRRADLQRLEQVARARPDYVPLGRSAVDLAVRGITSLSEALAIAGGTDEHEGSRDAAPAGTDSLVEEALEADALAEDAQTRSGPASAGDR